jgi:hypothetical protein
LTIDDPETVRLITHYIPSLSVLARLPAKDGPERIIPAQRVEKVLHLRRGPNKASLELGDIQATCQRSFDESTW